MIEAGGRTAQSFGVNRLYGQIYMLLFMNSEPLSLDAIARELGVSKASISIAARQLESWGAVHRTWQRGDRRDYYIAETDFDRILSGSLMVSLRKKLESARIQIRHCKESLDRTPAEAEDTDVMRERLDKAERYRAKIDRLLNNPLVRRLF